MHLPPLPFCAVAPGTQDGRFECVFAFPDCVRSAVQGALLPHHVNRIRQQ